MSFDKYIHLNNHWKSPSPHLPTPRPDLKNRLSFCHLRFSLHFYIPGSSDGKESACNAGDLGSIPGSGRWPGEGNGNSLQYSCLEKSMDRVTWWATVHGVTKSWTWLRWLSTPASRVEGFPGGSMVKNLPAMQEMWVWSLSWEDPLEEDIATHSSILAWKIP